MMSRKVKQQVNSAVNELDMNLANNYKDLAHKALKELDELVTKLNEEGQLKEKDYTKLRDKVDGGISSLTVCHNDIISSLKDYDRETAEQRMYVASRSYLSVCISIASLSLCEAS